MSLTENQKRLFESFSNDRQLKITQEFQPKYDSFQRSFPIRENLIKSHCQAKLDTQVDATIEWLELFGITPSQDDRNWFIQKISPLADFGVSRLRDYLDNPFGETLFDEGSKNELLYKLNQELNDLVAIAQRRLSLLLRERKEMARLDSKINWLFLFNLGLWLIGILVSITASAYSTEIRKCLDNFFGK